MRKTMLQDCDRVLVACFTGGHPKPPSRQQNLAKARFGEFLAVLNPFKAPKA